MSATAKFDYFPTQTIVVRADPDAKPVFQSASDHPNAPLSRLVIQSSADVNADPIDPSVYSSPKRRGITLEEAHSLVLAFSKSAGHTEFPSFDLIGYNDSTGNFYGLQAIWDNPSGSVNLGFYAVDGKTGDVWNSVICERVTSSSLVNLQRAIHKRIAPVTSINIQNPFNWRMTRGVSDYDRTHLFSGSYVWSLPNPKTVAGACWAAALIGGWQWSGIVTAGTGTPFGINSTNDAMAGAGSAFAVATGSLFLPSGRSKGDKIVQWFNTSAVTQADAGTYGSLGRNVLRNPGYTNFETRVSRLVPLHFRETASVQFLFEAFNALNHPILAGPDNRLGRTTFGQITSASGQRVLQFGLKVGW